MCELPAISGRQWRGLLELWLQKMADEVVKPPLDFGAFVK
jgi:hypothetical protein